ncbi:MAG TPA: AMP-binding protein [Acidimicrobiales bacterium]|nr:AMP-binding protein [Acidimicrobiales bacterium]
MTATLEGRPVWFPGDPEATNLGRFMAAEGIAGFSALRARSVAEPEWFWDAVVRFLDVPFATPYASVLDTGNGPEWATWFNGGRLNVAEVCLDRHAAARPDGPALVWEGEDGEVRRWTWAELRAEADGLAALLSERGVGLGDRVGVFLPMLPETVAALFGIMKVGAVFLPLFSGYGAPAVADRLADAGAKALVTADGTVRRGRVVDMAAAAAEAAASLPSLETVVVVRRLDVPGAPVPAGAEGWLEWPGPAAEPFPTRMVDSEHMLFIAYTSGTTGRPKGTVAVHGGFGVKVAAEAAFQFDMRPDDTLFWLTDMGWIMGPWEVVATLANGATVALFDGAPDWPGPDRLWAYLERHRVTMVGVSPTFVRALMPSGEEPVRAHDLSALRVLASTGEPWNLDPWFWYFEVVGGGRCPVINVSGGTEVGACFLTPHPVEPIKPMSLGGPALGMAMDVYDEEGRPVRGKVGELVCTSPWPGMTRGLYKDPERYLETYWSRWPGVWVHGDWASVDEDGAWFLHGRSDDTIKLAGKRLGPAEVESALVSHPLVVEAAAVGVPHDVKGEVLWCFVVLVPDATGTDALRAELTDLVGERLGHPFRPSSVRFTAALPKTRNAKVLRRAVRAVALGEDPGDLSSLEDPSTLAAIGAAE